MPFACETAKAYKGDEHCRAEIAPYALMKTALSNPGCDNVRIGLSES